MRQLIALVAALLATVLPANASSPAVPVGSEFQVNTYTPSSQADMSVAADAAGDFVVVWVSFQDGSGSGVFGQRFSTSGAPSGTEFQVNTYTPGSQGVGYGSIEVSSGADGDFVVVWPSADGSSNGIFGRRYDNTGAPIGAEFQANSYTPGYQYNASVASAPNGDFAVAWTDFGSRDGSSAGVFARRFDSSGAALGDDFQLNTYTPSSQGAVGPRLAFDADGNFVAVWVSNPQQDGSSGGVFGRRFDSSGGALGTEFQVNAYTPNYQGLPSVAADPDGNFVVVWYSNPSPDGGTCGVQARRFDSSGAEVGAEFQVNSFTPGCQYPFRDAVFADASGRFVIVWTDQGQDGDGSGAFGQQYDSNGLPLGTEFQINTVTTGTQNIPVVAGGSGGDFVVAWQSFNQDGSYNLGVFAQRFQAESLATDTPTETPTDTPTSTPTNTPIPTDTPTETPTDTPTSTPTYTATSTNTPTITPTATPIGACPLTVDAGCTTGFAKGTLLVKEDIAGKEKLVAKMVKGPALAQTALGNPLNTGGTVYSLCIYDDAGNLAGGINSSVVVDRAGHTCSGLPCWKAVGADPPSGKGYKYKDSALAADGVLKLLYKGGAAGKSKAIVKGKGPNLPDGIPAALQTTTFATVQLRASDGQCLSVAVDDIKKQTAGFFKAKFAAP